MIGVVWEQVETGQSSIWGPLIGASIGLALGILENSKLTAFTRSFSFAVAILAKSVVYLSVIAIPVMLLGLIGGLLDGKQLSEFFDWIFSLEFFRFLVLVYLIHFVIIFFRETAFRDANCIRVFIEIVAEIHSRRHHYLKEFAHVPEFKAGLHFGKVITAEIGDLKKEIVYNGDVLNTTARIESLCNQFGHKLIASEALVQSLSLPEFIKPISLGNISLRGKAEAMPLVALA